MITWKRIEAGFYQLYDNGNPTNIHVCKEAWYDENGKERFYGWCSGITEDGHFVGDGIFERRTLRAMKKVIEERYHNGTY